MKPRLLAALEEINLMDQLALFFTELILSISPRRQKPPCLSLSFPELEPCQICRGPSLLEPHGQNLGRGSHFDRLLSVPSLPRPHAVHPGRTVQIRSRGAPW